MIFILHRRKDAFTFDCRDLGDYRVRSLAGEQADSHAAGYQDGDQWVCFVAGGFVALELVFPLNRYVEDSMTHLAEAVLRIESVYRKGDEVRMEAKDWDLLLRLARESFYAKA